MAATREKKPTPNERWGQLVNGRLTDKQIFDLFDEFGMAKRLQTKEDYDWVRHNLPNIPEEMKKILKMELDKENIVRKEESKSKKEESSDGEGGPTLKNPGISSANPTSIANRQYIDALYQEAYGRRVTEQEWANFNGKTVKDSANLILGQNNSPFSTQGQSSNTANNTEINSTSSNQASAATSPVENNNTSSNWSTSPDYSLVKFTGDPNGADPGDASTLWWADYNTGTLRPIMSMQSLRDMYPDDQQYQAAINSINILNPTELQSGGKLANFIDLGESYGIYERGQMKPLDFNPMDMQTAYGQTRNEENTLVGVRAFDSFMNFLQNAGSGIDNSFLNKIKNDKVLTAFYINALAYGKYSPDDIYKDIKRQELISKGDTTLSKVKVISPNIDKNQYAVTNEGRLSSSLPSITPPAQIGNVSREVWSSPAAALSDSYYQLTSPEEYDPNSQVFKDRLDQIKSEFYDYVVQALTTGTERDKIAADEAWKQYKGELEKSYGYKLSDNALEAWRQLEKLDQSAAESGLAGSGIASEQTDEALKDYREQAKRLREEKANTLNDQTAAQAKANYSPDQIQSLNNEDQAAGLPRSEWRSVKWGLSPATALSLSSFISDFRTKYPDKSSVTDAEIKEKYYDNLYDQNGNYRSTLYQNYQDNLNKTKFGYTLNSVPGTSEDAYQRDTLLQQQLDKEEALQRDANTLESGKAFDKVPEVVDYSRQVTTPSNQSLSTETTSNPVIIPAAPVSSFAPKPGTTYIPNVASMKDYTNIYKDPNSNKLYGTLTKIVATNSPKPSTPVVNKPTVPNLSSSNTSSSTYKPSAPINTSSFSVKPGTEYIPNVAAMSKYTNIYKDPNSSKLYGTLKK